MALPWDLWASPEHRDRAIGRLTTAWRQAIERDPYLRTAVIVVELVFGDGSRHRVATEPVETLTEDGESRWVLPALQDQPPTIERRYDLDRQSAGARTVNVQVPTWSVDLAQRLKLGLPLQGFGEVSLLVSGMSWRDRIVLVRGDMGKVGYGAQVNDPRRLTEPYKCEGQALTTTLNDPRTTADGPFPPYVVEEDSWENAADTARGLPYPVIYGSGIVEALRVDASASQPRFVVTVGHGFEVQTIWRNGASATGSFTVDNADYDDLGRPVTTVLANLGAFTWADSDRVIVQARRSETEETLQALDIMRDVLERYSPGGVDLVNRPLFADAQSRLGSLLARAIVNEDSTVLSWIESGFLASFPQIALVWEGGRVGPVVTDMRAPPRARLELGGGDLLFRLTDPVETPRSQLFNRFKLVYDYDARLDSYAGIIQRGPDSSVLCSVSAGAMGARVHPTIEALAIRDRIAAETTIDWLVAHRTLPSAYVEYATTPRLFVTLRRGDTVDLVDPDFPGWGSVATATVERQGLQRGFCTLGLRVWSASRYLRE